MATQARGNEFVSGQTAPLHKNPCPENAAAVLKMEGIEIEPSTSSARDNYKVSRYFYVPECPDIGHLRALSIMNRWTETEFVVAEDLGDVAKLSEEEKNFYRFLFTFLSAADDLVNLNIDNLLGLFEQKDIHHYYFEQECIEAVHSRAYSIIQLMLFDNDSSARAKYVQSALESPVIQSKLEWLDRRILECTSIPEKYILMILTEGIFFSASFAAIAYLRTNNLFVVTCQINNLISRDEAIHVEASCCIFKNYIAGNKPSTARIQALFSEAVDLECAFLRAAAPRDSRLLDIGSICSYVRYSADRLLRMLDVPPIYGEPSPAADFPLSLMSASNNTNFFERRSTAYSGSVSNDL
ncbi:UL40 protein [Gallid alphaherpesvirus 3]|uniref:ribonucleoside-diphosphate reductase n=1 Tax=Gallid alphaherpesvirus 3 TaxID=35250 RepID=F8TC37_9ALPH|nr:UL40 protein [Gallid alphaherpesvirus 3]AEI00248.1 UL40 protein [Gallid alphaherpesvirus 3]QEY02252.1 UL40 protein [Gallid alphaherpesvirus 3]